MLFVRRMVEIRDCEEYISKKLTATVENLEGWGGLLFRYGCLRFCRCHAVASAGCGESGRRLNARTSNEANSDREVNVCEGLQVVA